MTTPRRSKIAACHLPVSLVFAVALACGAAQPALAWGALGHRTIAGIAEANVTPRTRAAIAHLIEAAPQLDTPACPIHSIEDAATWPDCLRGDPAKRFEATFPWHYQDIPVCTAVFDPKAGCADGNCVTAKITEDERILADRSRPPVERMRALAFLVHFVGDIHQPLHAADDDDHGGNAEVVTNASPLPTADNPHPRPTSLHWFWDDTLVERALAAPQPSLVHAYPAAQRARLGDGAPVDWARESWGLARRVVYPQALGANFCAKPVPANVTITDAASAPDLPIVRHRLTQAGLRLAHVLDTALGG